MNLNFKVFGEGKDLIILHGLLGSLDNWLTLAKQLSENHRVWILDQRNHGRSFHSADHSYDLMAEDLLGFLDEKGIEKAHLLGHSMGGKSVLKFAKEHKERCKSICVVDMPMRKMDGGHMYIFEALEKLDPSQLESRKQADDELAQAIGQSAVRDFLLKNLNRVGQSFKWKMNLPILKQSYSEIAKAIAFDEPMDIPCGLIYGSESGYIESDDLHDYASQFSYFRPFKVEGSGHWVHAEKPQEFLNHYKQFIHDLSS